MKFTIMVGNPVDGIELLGIFDNPEAANEWGDRADLKEVWWVVPINSVDYLEDIDEKVS